MKRRYSDTTLGIFYMLVSTFAFCFMNVFVRLMKDEGFSPVESIFYRSIIMGGFALYFILQQARLDRRAGKKAIVYKKGGYVTLMFRAIIGGSAMLAIFYNLGTIPIGTTTAFSSATALYTVVLSVVLLHERQSLGVIIASIMGFSGVVLICDPHFGSIPTLNIILGIYCGVAVAIAYTTIKLLKPYFSNSMIILVYAGVMIVGSFFMMVFHFPYIPSSYHMPSPSGLIYMVGLGITGAIGQFYMTKSYTIASPGIVTPIGYLGIIITTVFGLFLGEIPSLVSILGMGLIFSSGVLISMPALLADLKSQRMIALMEAAHRRKKEARGAPMPSRGTHGISIASALSSHSLDMSIEEDARRKEEAIEEEFVSRLGHEASRDKSYLGKSIEKKADERLDEKAGKSIDKRPLGSAHE